MQSDEIKRSTHMVAPIVPNKGTHVQIGDYVTRAGIYTKPGVVTEKKEDGTVIIDTNPEQIKKYHRHSNTSGLTLEEKERFNGIMDEVMAVGVPVDRIQNLQLKIDALKATGQNKKIVQSLNNEQAQLIRLAKELPKVFAYDVEKLG